MSGSGRIPIQMLGQSGCRLSFPEATVYLDPYLSNSVQELDAPDLERQVPIVCLPESVVDADWVLITHEHIDHCDPHTLPKLADASPQARFVGPMPVLERLREWGLDESRIMLASEDWTTLTPGLRLRAVPAAHPEIVRDAQGRLACVGYLLRRSSISLATPVRSRKSSTLSSPTAPSIPPFYPSMNTISFGASAASLATCRCVRPFIWPWRLVPGKSSRCIGTCSP